jgi:hypothetical protein
MKLHNAWLQIVQLWEWLKLSPKQKLFVKFISVGILMSIGGAGIVAGLPLLAVMMLEYSVVGVIVSALSVSFGLALVVAGYLWFTI